MSRYSISFFACIAGITIPFILFAAPPQSAKSSIITHPGVTTPPIKYYFDVSPSLQTGVNHTLTVSVSASNSEKTAIRFDTVQLFGASGALMGRNVASLMDALTATPYSFKFNNFGVASADLKNVAGIQITFFDAGGDNPSGKVTIQGVAVALERSIGEACISDGALAGTTPKTPVAAIKKDLLLAQVSSIGISKPLENSFNKLLDVITKRMKCLISFNESCPK